jgi:hypothetical protein
MERYQLIPVLLTRAETVHSADAQLASQTGVLVLTSTDVEDQIKLFLTDRTSSDLIHLENRKRFWSVTRLEPGHMQIRPSSRRTPRSSNG